MGRPKVQVSQQVANLPVKATYANNTSDAQIQISPLEYNLGQKAEKRWEKREDSDCRDERRRGKKAPISQLTHSLEYDLNTFMGEGGGTWAVRDCTCS